MLLSPWQADGPSFSMLFAGITVPPGDTEALANAIRTLADNKDLRCILGANARQRAIDRWDKGPIQRSVNREISALCIGRE